ncbi:MAG TPA: hypothetical protein ENJ31_10415 [Anaerolineae bacterium]|nr:hypothetical protein [Anaerolineae bacterium]
MRTKHILTGAALLLSLLAVLGLCTPFGRDVWAGGRPTATPQALPPAESASPAAPDALPDLIVEQIRLSPPEPFVQQTAQALVVIKNVGTADVTPGNNFHLDLYINPPTDDLKGIPGDYYADVQGYQMKVGASVTFVFTLTDVFTDAASYNLWAQVDTPQLPDYPNGFVTEANEDNNILGPEYVTVRTHYAWVQKDHTQFFTNMASTLDVQPLAATACQIPHLDYGGDSVLTLGLFDEPPLTTWGITGTLLPPTSAEMLDYNMIYPDIQVNEVITNDQRYPSVYADGDLVVVVWEDGQNGPTFGKDIFMRWSDDQGITWSDPITVNETYGNRGINDQKHPAVATSGDYVVVAWQDHRGSSFDIYVQTFFYTGSTMRRCDANGDCTTECVSADDTWCNKRVDTDANEKDQILPDVAVDPEEDTFYIAWQDQRYGNDDIFAVRSYIDSHGNLIWGDDTRISDDPGTSRQANPSIDAVRSIRITGFDYTVDPGPPPEVVVTHVYSEPATYIVVAWEDEREGDADIYLTYSDDGGETFAADTRLNDDKAANTSNGIAQRVPATAVSGPWIKEVTLLFPTIYGLVEDQVRVPVTTFHVTWQDFRHSTNPSKDNDPDIYYMALTTQPDAEPPWVPVVEEETAQTQVNVDDARSWQTSPVWQGEPDVEANLSGTTLQDTEGYNAYVIWSDGRNYGGEFENLDIYLRLFGNVDSPSAHVTDHNLMVNDGARLHDFDTGNADYESYRLDNPPHAHQRNPAIAATLVANWPLATDGYIYVVWDDDRIGDPFMDRNIYFARSNLLFGGHGRTYSAASGDIPGQGAVYGAGSFVSEIFDSGSPDTVWYIVDWEAVTESGTYITLQTRLGDTRAEVLASDWYPHDKFPYPDDPGSIGSPLLGYDAPGRHIVDENGDYWPQARYIQYRVNFWARDVAAAPNLVTLNTPCLFDVVLHYERPPIIYLPIVFKNH